MTQKQLKKKVLEILNDEAYLGNHLKHVKEEAFTDETIFDDEVDEKLGISRSEFDNILSNFRIKIVFDER